MEIEVEHPWLLMAGLVAFLTYGLIQLYLWWWMNKKRRGMKKHIDHMGWK